MSAENEQEISEKDKGFKVPDESQRIDNPDVAELMARKIESRVQTLEAMEKRLTADDDPVERAQITSAFETLSEKVSNVFGGPHYQELLATAARGELQPRFVEVFQKKKAAKEEMTRLQESVPTMLDRINVLLRRMVGQPEAAADVKNLEKYNRLMELQREVNTYDVDLQDCGDLSNALGRIQMAQERNRLDRTIEEWQKEYDQEVETIRNLDAKESISLGAYRLQKARPVKITLDLARAIQEQPDQENK